MTVDYENQVRRDMEQAAVKSQCPIEEDIDAAMGLVGHEYPRSGPLRQFAKDSKRLRKLGVKGQRQKAAQRKLGGMT